MDIVEYIGGDQRRLGELAVAARLQIVRLKRLVADPTQPVRYMTARRLVAASGGVITMSALERRGPLRGRDTYDGPLGSAIADAAATGRDVPSRLAAAGIPSDHFTEVLLRGRVPSRDRMTRYAAAFGPQITETLFREHAEWRRARA